MVKSIILVTLLFAATIANAQLVSTNDVGIHDPVLISEEGTYYLFGTGMGISVWSSKDLKSWQQENPVFATAPQWAVGTIPNFKGHIWAPDIYFHKGLYYLYYSVSAFGKNTSAIGVATNKTLNPTSPDFKWTDHGRVIQSYPGITNWNAIDPNIIEDKRGNAYMSFGSFWDGLKLVKLSKDRLSVAEDVKAIPTIASRKLSPGDPNPPAIDDNPQDAGGNAIEAPFIFKRGKYYYLFASIDYCCKGVKSTYKMVVGRAEQVAGPYLDDKGFDLAKAGGRLVLKGDERWHGVGHNAVVSFDGVDYLVFHAYDGMRSGRSFLQIKKISWDKQGWPIVEIE